MTRRVAPSPIRNAWHSRLPKRTPVSGSSLVIEAGEIDDLLPAARRAPREAAKRVPAASRGAAKASIANSLLAALPHAEYRRLLVGLELVTLKFGEVLHEPGVPIQYVYFPIDCAISLLTALEGERALEVGLVGHEGMVGVSFALGTEVSSIRALVQTTGTAMRMKAARFREAFRRSPPLQCAVYRYVDTKLASARQVVACNCFHAADARLARWLLMTSDRALSAEFFLTQAFLADMLGVRRATVNEAASTLQRRNLISYCRGKIRILDRKGLEAVSCRCYTRVGV